MKLGSFENSLRNGGEKPSKCVKTKSHLNQSHHRACSGDAHGCGIEKWKRNLDKCAQQAQRVYPHQQLAKINYHSPRNQQLNTRRDSANSLDSCDDNSKGSNCDLLHKASGKPIRVSKRTSTSSNRTSFSKSETMSTTSEGSLDSAPFLGIVEMRKRDLALHRTTKSESWSNFRKTERTSENFGKDSCADEKSSGSRNAFFRRSSVRGSESVADESFGRRLSHPRKLSIKNSTENDHQFQNSLCKPLNVQTTKIEGPSCRASSVKKTISRRPPVSGTNRKYLALPKVTWNELYDIALNRKPNSGDDSNNVLYKDLDDLLIEKAQRSVTEAKSEEQLETERSWLEAEKLWLVHRAGFTAVRLIAQENGHDTGDIDNGKIRIQLEATGEVLSVDDDDLEKANPPQFDKIENLANLRYVNESSIIHTLRLRYAGNLIHTYAGNSLLVINPMAPLALYSEKVVQMFRGCKTEDMPPHIYSMAQSAFRAMLATRRDQSLVLLGRSASGKTTNFRHALQYLVLAAGSVNKVLTVEKMSAICTVLEGFGNARTVLNQNATRFTQIFSLDFDQSGQIASASIQIPLMERNRVVRRPEGESSYHIFYWLLAGAEGSLRRELGLDIGANEQNIFMTPLQKHEDKQKALLEFGKISIALRTLGITDSEIKVIWSVIAAIYLLGIAGVAKVTSGNNSNSRWQFFNPQAAQRAASLLGTTSEELARCLFGEGTPSTPRAPFRTPSPIDRIVDRENTPLELLEGLAVGLYGEVFNAVAALINRSISTPLHTVSSIIAVDCPGFQNPASCGHQGGATFEDLCHNYLQERLQLLFHHTMLVAPCDRYAQEHIECNLDDIGENGFCSPAPMVSLFDRASQNAMIRTSQMDLRDVDRKGLLWLLDEEAVYPNASDEGFLERLFTHYGDRDHQMLLRKAPGNNQFVLHHLQGTNPVLYTANGWLKSSRENPVARLAITFLQESSKEEVSKLFVCVRGPGVSSTLGGSVVGIEGTQSLRRASSMRRTFTTGTAGIKRKSMCLQVKFTVDGLVETLRRTRLKFIHCLLPHHNAGLSDLRNSMLKISATNTNPDDFLINVPLIRSQLRGGQILDAVRLYKQGFPKHLPLAEFNRRFRLLAPLDGRPPSPILDERKAVEDVLSGMDIDAASYRVGLSQVFFRAGVLAQLESQRDEKLTDNILQLQARCRGLLARRKFTKLKVQDVAVRCIQRNVRKFMSVRDWPWWRLLVRVTPLLNVHRTEEELRLRTEELEALRAKLEKMEQERSQLKHENDRLEARVL